MTHYIHLFEYGVSMKNKVIILDVDGTLIDYKGLLPKSAEYAVIKAREKGHKVYICTGCSKIEIEVKKWDLDLDGMIGGNGCYIESGGKTIFHKTLTFEECRHFVDWCKSNEIAFRLECNDGMYISDDYEEKSKEARMRYIYGNVIKTNVKIPMNPCMVKGANLYRDDVNKTAFVLREYNDYLEAKKVFKDLKVGTWGGKGEMALYGDISPSDVSKESACLKLQEYLDIKAEDMIAFGDAKVDIPMFKACGMGIAMGNGGEEIKEAADLVTDDVDKDGLYKAFVYLGLIENDLNLEI